MDERRVSKALPTGWKNFGLKSLIRWKLMQLKRTPKKENPEPHARIHENYTGSINT